MTSLTIFFYISSSLYIGLCIYAAWSDFKAYRLPNMVMLAILILFFPMAFAVYETASMLSHLYTGLGVLTVCFILFACRIFAAGDAKYLSVAAVWAGPEYLFILLTVMAVSGGVLALIQILRSLYQFELASGYLNFKKHKSSIAKLELPYGVAISTGALVVTYLQIQSFVAANSAG